MISNERTHTFDLSAPADNVQVVLLTKKILEQEGVSETRQYLLAAAVSELSTNIIKYAGSGNLSIRIFEEDNQKIFEVIAQDQGPGIADLHAAMTDNYSSGTGLGLGLPSVKRIMDEFDIQSSPGIGTQVRAQARIS